MLLLTVQTDLLETENSSLDIRTRVDPLRRPAVIASENKVDIDKLNMQNVEMEPADLLLSLPRDASATDM